MIIFGTRGTQIDSEPIENVTCPSCQHEGMQSGGVVRYFHVYWIPMFTTKREPVLVCPHCKCCLVGDEMDADVRTELKKVVFTRGRTWFYNLGALALGSFVLLTLVSGAIGGIAGAISKSSAEPPQATAPSRPPRS